MLSCATRRVKRRRITIRVNQFVSVTDRMMDGWTDARTCRPHQYSLPTIARYHTPLHNEVPAGDCRRRHDCVCATTTGWLASRVVSVLDSGAEGPGFESQSRRCRVTVLGRGKSGPALGGTEYRLMPSACRLIVRQPL